MKRLTTVIILFALVFLSPIFAIENSVNVRINEIMPHPSSGPDWVEIYNPLSHAVNLSGWKLNDSSAASIIYTFTDTEAISNGEFVAVNILLNRLNKNGETVSLLNNLGVIVDNLTYFGSFQNESIGYISDNQSKGLANFTSSTKGYSNFQPPFNLSNPGNFDLLPNMTFAYDFNVTNSGVNLNERYVDFNINITPNVGTNYLLNNSGMFTFSSNQSNQFYDIIINASDNLGRNAVSQFEIRVFEILFSNFSASNLTTDLNFVNLSNVTELVLASDDYGYINFTIPSGGRNLLGLNLNNYIIISNNLIEVNSSALPALNLSAELTINNISVTTPNITRNGIRCPDKVCTLINYNSSSNSIKFNVTGFSYYSVEEKKLPLTPPPSSPSSGGGGSSRGSSGGSSGGALFIGNSDESISEEIIKEPASVQIKNNVGNMQMNVGEQSNKHNNQNSLYSGISEDNPLTGAVIGISAVKTHPVYTGLILFLLSFLSVRFTKSLRRRRARKKV